jgi:hypothetical protein
MPRFTIVSTTGDAGIFTSSRDGEGLHSESHSSLYGAIAGIQHNTDLNHRPPAIYGESHGGGAAIAGFQRNGASMGNGVYGETIGDGHAIHAYLNNPNSQKAALYAEHSAGLTAGFFRGNVIVTGDISFPGADCAENFTIEDSLLVEPGTVMSLGMSGSLVPVEQPYEKKVVGVVSGAGDFRPGIILDRQESADRRCLPIALVGKVFCKVDATYGAIDIGDLLTSSATRGHAMRASDPTRAFGAVIGKAMAPLTTGVGLIPILIALQ